MLTNETRTATQQHAVLIQLGPEDLVHAQRLHFWQFMRSRGGIIQLAVLSIAATALFALLMFGARGKGFMSPTLAFAPASPFIVVASCIGVLFILGGRVARKAFSQQKTLQMPYRISWTDQGILLQSEYGDARMPWGDFRKLREDRNIILLYESDRLHRLIPKRCFTAAQLADFQACMALAPRR